MDVLVLFSRAIFGILAFSTMLAVRLTRGVARFLWRLIRPRSKTFGSARWTYWWELLFAGHLTGAGIIVGKTWGRFIRFNAPGYAVVFAPTRSGKGVGIVVPNLLSYKGSVICTDPKGENAAVTGRYRSGLGPTFVLDALHPELSDQLNPLDAVRIGSYHEADDAMKLATALVIPDSSNGGHWDNRSAAFLQALILFVRLRYANDPMLCNLAKVRSLVALGAGAIQPIIEEAMTLGSTTLRESMHSFKNMASSEEAKSIFSNCEKAMSLWGADRPAGMISMRSDFSFADFNRQTMTCYVIVDEEQLGIYQGFLRVYMSLALMAMTRAKEEAPPEHPTLFLLDETAALGNLEPLESGIGYISAYARLVLVFQDWHQLKQTYRKAHSILANATCKIAFGVNDAETAKMLAETIGHKTVRSHSAGQSGQTGDFIYQQSNQGKSEAARYLIDPAEIMRLSRKKCLIFFNGSVTYPVLAKKVRYYAERRWKGLWDKWRAPRAEVIPFPELPPPDALDQEDEGRAA